MILPISWLVPVLFVLALLPFPYSAAQEARWQQDSEQSRFVGTLAPRQGSVQIGVFQHWVLTLKSADGAPVYPARIGIGGGMAAHGHGLPTQPQVTSYLGEGRYLIEGVKLNMAGDWTLAFTVRTPEIQDRVIFEFNVEH